MLLRNKDCMWNSSDSAAVASTVAAAKTIYLFRHGMTECNKRYAYCGITDVPVCSEGKEQLMEMKKQFAYPDISRCTVVTSGMKRTIQTLKILYPDYCTRAEKMPALQEMNFGVFEGKSYEELKSDSDYQSWITGDNEKNVCPGGESGLDMKRRVLDAFRSIAEDANSYALFMHGGPMACIMESLFPNEHKNRWQWQRDFGMGYALTCSVHEWQYVPIPQLKKNV